jgi:hypothetical protein
MGILDRLGKSLDERREDKTRRTYARTVDEWLAQCGLFAQRMSDDAPQVVGQLAPGEARAAMRSFR